MYKLKCGVQKSKMPTFFTPATGLLDTRLSFYIPKPTKQPHSASLTVVIKCRNVARVNQNKVKVIH